MMNTIVSFLCLIYAFTPIVAQGPEYVKIFESKNYRELSKHLDSNVQVEIGRVKQSLSREEAVSKLRERLNSFKPMEWELMHKGESESNDAKYIIIKATNKAGDGLRVFLYVKDTEGRRKITAIRFRQAL